MLEENNARQPPSVGQFRSVSNRLFLGGGLLPRRAPLTDNSSLIPILRLALIQCHAGRVRRQWGCHLYFARRVTFLSCADMAQTGSDDR